MLHQKEYTLNNYYTKTEIMEKYNKLSNTKKGIVDALNIHAHHPDNG